jgi:hypothetical protein
MIASRRCASKHRDQSATQPRLGRLVRQESLTAHRSFRAPCFECAVEIFQHAVASQLLRCALRARDRNNAELAFTRRSAAAWASAFLAVVASGASPASLRARRATPVARVALIHRNRGCPGGRSRRLEPLCCMNQASRDENPGQRISTTTGQRWEFPSVREWKNNATPL